MTTVRFVLPGFGPRIAPPPRPLDAPRRGDRAARQLALAYRIEAAIDSGEIRDQSHAAALLGVSRARITTLLSMTQLAPDVQERVLCGHTNIHERDLRAALRFVGWDDQRAALDRNRT